MPPIPRRQSPARSCWRCCSPWLLPLALLAVLTILRIAADERSKRTVLVALGYRIENKLLRESDNTTSSGALRGGSTPDVDTPTSPIDSSFRRARRISRRQERLDVIRQRTRTKGTVTPTQISVAEVPDVSDGSTPKPAKSVQDEVSTPSGVADKDPGRVTSHDEEVPHHADVVQEVETAASHPSGTAALPTDPSLYVCTSAEILNASAWFEAISHSSWQLSCGSLGRVLDAVHAASPSRAGGKDFMSIGAGLGYVAAGWAARWRPEARTSSHPRSLRAYWEMLRPEVFTPGGSCDEANDIVPDTTEVYKDAGKSLGGPAEVRVWAVEAAPRTFAALAKSPLSKSSNAGGFVTVLHGVGANALTSDQLGFEDCAVGQAACRLPEYGDGLKPTVQVKAVTVDGLLAGGHLFALHVTTEGSEPLVLAGAALSLAQGRVDVVSFEYNGIGQWSGGRDSLERVSSWLNSLRYSCFLESRSRLWVITPGCWHKHYETTSLSRITCVHRGQGTASILNALYAMSNVPHATAAATQSTRSS